MPTVQKATDNFDRANEAPLSGGGNWSAGGLLPAGQFDLVGNVAVPHDLSGDMYSAYSGRSWTNDQSSKAKLTVSGTGGGGRGIGLGCRFSEDAFGVHGYFLNVDHAASNNCTIARRLSSAYTALLTFTQAFSDGDTWEFTVEGAASAVVCKAYLSGSLLQTTSPDNSTVPLPGAPGLHYSSSETSASVNDWEGGELSAGQALVPDADLAAGGWATAPLFSKLNDASDATIITATAS